MPGYFTLGRRLAPPAHGISQARLVFRVLPGAPRLTPPSQRGPGGCPPQWGEAKKEREKERERERDKARETQKAKKERQKKRKTKQDEHKDKRERTERLDRISEQKLIARKSDSTNKDEVGQGKTIKNCTKR